MPTRLLRRFLYAAAFASLLLPFAAPAHKTRNVIFVMTDGLRWQEVFRGADPAMMDKEHGGVSDARHCATCTGAIRPNSAAKR